MRSVTCGPLAWLLTSLIASTALRGIAWLVTRGGRLEPAAADLLWKVAVLAPLITGTIQSRFELATPAAVRLPVATAPQAPSVAEPSIDPSNQSIVRQTTSTTSTTSTNGLSLPLVVVPPSSVFAPASPLYSLP